jgi:hypothetical protein
MNHPDGPEEREADRLERDTRDVERNELAELIADEAYDQAEYMAHWLDLVQS